MKIIKYLCILLGIFFTFSASAQFNPANPPEPGVMYRLSLQGAPSGGVAAQEGAAYSAGSSVYVYTSINSGYNFEGWYNDMNECVNKNNSFYFTMPQANTTLTARYRYNPSNPAEPSAPADYARLDITVVPKGGGSCNYSGKYSVGSTVNLYPSINSNYKFKSWTRNGEVISTVQNFSYVILKDDNNIVLNLEYDPRNPGEPESSVTRPQSHRLNIKVSPPEAGYTNIASGNKYETGAKIALSAYNYSNFSFNRWEDADGTTVSVSSSFNYNMPGAESTLTAIFDYNPTNPSEPGGTEPRRNVVYGSRQSARPGAEVFYDILLENVDPATGMNVDVTMPQGFIADYSRATTSSRSASHNLSTLAVDNSTVRVSIRGTTTLAGNSGAVARIPVKVPANATAGESFNIVMTKGVVYLDNGNQSASPAINGIIKIAEKEIGLPDSPDLIIGEIKTDKVTVMPGDHISMDWSVVNTGSLPAMGGWSESIYLTDADGYRAHLTTLYYDIENLAVNESVSRSATITVPDITGIDGSLDLQIVLTPYASTGEAEDFQLNNSLTTTGQPINLGKRLYLQIPSSIAEGAGNQARCLLSRSGSWSESQSFTLEVKGDPRLKVPASVTIPRERSGAYFIISVDDNDFLDDSSDFSITASGNGYDPITGNIEVIDDEFPEIILSFPSDSITEGDKTTLTITLPRPSQQDVIINLSCDAPDRFDFDNQVVIPEGLSMIEVPVTAIDNNRIENIVDVSFMATAPHYGNGETFQFLLDNDMPVLDLQLTPEETSEGAGTRAIRATVTRSNDTAGRITLMLSDDRPGNLSYNKSIVLEQGVTSVDFNIDVIDNTRVDGDREVNFTAAVFLSSCGCSATGESKGSVTRTITIIDNDGPSLNLSTATATLHRDKRATSITIGRNTNINDPLTVTLSATPEGVVNFPSTVSFPSGKSEVSVDIEAPLSSFDGKEKTITINATSGNYAKGTLMILVSDRTLPDPVVSLSYNDTESSFPGQRIEFEATVSNEGNTDMPDAIVVNLLQANTSVPVATAHTTKLLAPGESELLKITFDAPAIPGNYQFTAHVNDSKEPIQELTRTNNASAPVVLTVKSPFMADINADKSTLLPGEKVTLTGSAPGYGSDLEIYYISSGARRSEIVKPDPTGKFSISIDPQFPGDYIAGVCIPGEEKSDAMVSFSLQGFDIDRGSYSVCDIAEGESAKLKMRVNNLSSIPLHDITVETTASARSRSAAVEKISTLPGNSTVEITLEVEGTDLTVGDDWEQFEIKATSREGVTASKPLYYYCRPNRANLVSSVTSINTTMTMGQQRIYRFVISNNGKAPSGDITLSLPSFMSKGTATTLPSIELGEKASVDILLTPTPDMRLNVPVKGRIGVNCANGDGIVIPFSIEPVSDLNGNLIIDVKDEYTFYTEEAPHVADATIIISHPVSGKMIANGKTDVNGLWNVTLPEGFYNLEVSADRHGSWAGTIQIAPGVDNEKAIFIPFNAITYDWHVEETTVDDKYEIVTTVDFETRVPKPVIVVDFPKLSYRNQIVYFSITNKGLISATNVELIVPESDDEMQFTILSDALIPELKAGENRMIPVRVTVDEEDKYPEFTLTTSSYSYTGSAIGDDTQAKARGVKGRASGCKAEDTEIQVDETECDPDTGERKPTGKKKSYKATYRTGECGHPASWPPGAHVTSAPSFPATPNGPMPRPGDGIPGGKTDKDKTSLFWQEQVQNTLVNGCLTDCEKALANALANCGLAAGGCVPGGSVVTCGPSLLLNCYPGHAQDFSTAADCWLAGAGCAPGPAGCAAGIAGCIKAAYEAFHKCLEANRKYKQKHSPVMKPYAVESDDNLDAMERRAEIFMAYAEYYLTVNESALNMMGTEGWDNASSNDVALMLTFLRDNRDENGYFPVGDKALPGKPANVTLDTYNNFIERFNNSIKYDITGETSDNMVDLEMLQATADKFDEISNRIDSLGFPTFEAFTQAAGEEIEHIQKLNEESSAGVCATITMKFNQTMVLTRQAFRGTLTITNGNETVEMADIKLNVKVRDAEGILVGDREFAVMAESIEGFKGKNELNTPWSLDAKGKGEATILFIPSRFAAPVEPVVYSFGGVLSYTDPFSGNVVSRELSPIKLTVNPSPILNLDYFMQRDVIGDDPLTEDRIESSLPAEFALLITNTGFGDADNLTMSTSQPRIVDNAKGLAIDFEIIGTSLNGKPATVAIGDRVPTDFGTLPSLKTTYAQWWMKSSLMGHFTSYDVKATQISAYGCDDMSLLESANIHELIHGMTPPAATTEGARAFLVNDVKDAEGLPDMIWMSESGTAYDVAIASATVTEPDGLNNCTLTVTSAGQGWQYGRLDTAWDGNRQVVKAVRNSDGKELPADNFWTTFVTMVNSSAPKYENKLHFAVDATTTSESYTLTLENRPDPELKVLSIDGIPAEGEINQTPVTHVEVIWNKGIDNSTFDHDDITLTCQGSKIEIDYLDISEIGRSSDGDHHSIDLTPFTKASGYYTLTIDPAGVADNDGFNGSEATRASWIQLADGKVNVTAIAIPAGGGSVDPAGQRVDYGTAIKLSATPAPGYEFIKWTHGTDILSTGTTLSVTPVEDMVLKAVFALSQYEITISYDENQGSISGGASGIYDYGTKLDLTAIPAPGYEFLSWIDSDGTTLASTPHLEFDVKESKEITALFKSSVTGIATVIDNGVSRLYPMPVRTRFFISGNFDTIESVVISDIAGKSTHIVKGCVKDLPINVSNLPAGTYIVTVTTEKGSSSHKMVKL